MQTEKAYLQRGKSGISFLSQEGQKTCNNIPNMLREKDWHLEFYA